GAARVGGGEAAAGRGVVHAVAHGDPGESFVACELLDREELAHQPTAPSPDPMEPGPVTPPAATINVSSRAWWRAARSTSSGASMSDWMSISPSRQSSSSSCSTNFSDRIVGASVIVDVLFTW